MKILRWLLSKTKLGKLLDGNKTLIGFLLFVLKWLLEGVTAAAAAFPDAAFLGSIAEFLKQVLDALGPILEQLGIGFLVVGVGHKAIKEKDNGVG